MFAERLTAERPVLDRALEALDLAGSPPAGLAAVLSWDDAAGARTVLVWEGPPSDGDLLAEGAQRTGLDTLHVHVRTTGSGQAPGLVPTAFVDLVTAPTEEAELVAELTGMRREPPVGLVAHVEWASGPGQTTAIMAWGTPDQRGEWSERVMVPLFTSGRLRPTGGAMTHPRPVLVWARP